MPGNDRQPSPPGWLVPSGWPGYHSPRNRGEFNVRRDQLLAKNPDWRMIGVVQV